MSLGTGRRWKAGTRWIVLTLLAGGMVCSTPTRAQATLTRKTKLKVAPLYPEMARRLNISGTVRVEVVVAPNGSLKSSRVLGGHPVLVSAAVDALKKWKFEPAADETSGIVEFKFQPME